MKKSRTTIVTRAVLILAFIDLVIITNGQVVNKQVIYPPSQFTNPTQWGIGVGATPTHDACYIIGYNLTDGQAFAQYFEEDPDSKEMLPVGLPVYGNVMSGFDATEMNPAGALLTTDKQTFIWSISTINNSNWAYGYVYFDHLEDGEWVRKQTFVDPIPGASRIYGGAMAGVNDGSLFAIGAAVYPVSGPGNTIPSTVEVWELNNGTGLYEIEHTVSNIELRTGLYAYSLDVSQDKRWLAVGAWNYRPRSIFIYDRFNNYTLTTALSPFGNTSRFSYSMSFSPDSEWLVVGVFQYPGVSFVGLTVAYRFNSTLDTWNTNPYFLSTGYDIGSGSAGQGSSVSVSGPYQTSNGTTAWTLVYGMPYIEINGTDVGGVSVWTFGTPEVPTNWTETLPPLTGFGNLTQLLLLEDNITRHLNWRYNISEDAPSLTFLDSADPYLDLGWTSTPNRMVSYDGCSAIVPGISNIGVSSGFVFRWLNLTEGCPRSAPEPPTSPPGNEPSVSPSSPSPTSPSAASIALVVVGSLLLLLFIVVAITMIVI